MAGIDIVHAAEQDWGAQHPIDGHALVGAGGRAKQVSPSTSPLWLVSVELPNGSELVLPEVHGDEAVAVLSGEVAVDGRTCPAAGAVVVEAGAGAVRLRATQDAALVHVGPHDAAVPTDGLNGAPAPGTGVHVVGPGGTWAVSDGYRDTHYFADSTCPTCRLTLLYTSRSSEYVSPTHSHSADELIHLLRGELRLGNQVLRPGDTLAVAADRRYGFRSGPDGFAFLNYRRDASAQTVERGAAPLVEGGEVNGLRPVMDLR